MSARLVEQRYREDRVIKEIIDRIEVLTKRVASIEERMKRCKCGCCR